MKTQNLLYLLIPLIPVLIFNLKYHITINKRIIYVIARMSVQLAFIGIILQWLFDNDNGIINLLYVVFMMTIASYTMLKTTGLPIIKFAIPIMIAVFIPHIIVLLFFNYFVVDVTEVLSARYLIPVGGMLLGNSLSGNILAINTFYTTLQEQEKKYFYALSLSTNRNEALFPYFKNALRSSINPTMASIETIGLVALPGMMTGQILGGSIPITAIKYQIAIMVAIFITRYFTAILAIKLTSLTAFDDYDRLKIYDLV